VCNVFEERLFGRPREYASCDPELKIEVAKPVRNATALYALHTVGRYASLELTEVRVWCAVWFEYTREGESCGRYHRQLRFLDIDMVAGAIVGVKASLFAFWIMRRYLWKSHLCWVLGLYR